MQDQLDQEFKRLRHKVDRVLEARDMRRFPGLRRQMEEYKKRLADFRTAEATRLRVPSEPRKSYFFESWIEQKMDKKGEFNDNYQEICKGNCQGIKR